MVFFKPFQIIDSIITFYSSTDLLKEKKKYHVFPTTKHQTQFPAQEVAHPPN
jgi:hypothetical protein